MTALTADRLRELLDYDPATGIFTWRLSKGPAKAGSVAGSFKGRGYRLIRIDGGSYLEHRLAWLHVHGKWPLGQIDHRDTVRHNNAIGNLRLATQTQNLGNSHRRSNNTSGFKGVSFRRPWAKWQAGIRVNGKRVHLGLFTSAEEAHAAYLAKALELFGEFARAE